MNGTVAGGEKRQYGARTVDSEPPCPYCSGPGVFHFHGGPCPRIKAIEYHQNGMIKRVEFKD